MSRPAVLAVLAALAVLAGVIFAPSAHADPPPACNAPGTPPCAPALPPDQLCALIAWRTWTPCNWYGVKVPEGTPGSVG